jgi:hypothetical protein
LYDEELAALFPELPFPAHGTTPSNLKHHNRFICRKSLYSKEEEIAERWKTLMVRKPFGHLPNKEEF